MFPFLMASQEIGDLVVPFYPFLGEGSPTKIDYRKKGTLILASLLEVPHTLLVCRGGGGARRIDTAAKKGLGSRRLFQDSLTLAGSQ